MLDTGFFPDIGCLFVRLPDISGRDILTPSRFNSNFERMTDDRKSGLALITAMVGTIITMAFHPTGHGLQQDQFKHIELLNIAVHSLALFCIPVLFLGALGLTRRLASPNRLALAALVFHGFASVAVMLAAAMSGLVGTYVARQMTSSPPGAADTWHIAFHLSGYMNQAFAQIFVVASSVAIVLWSVAMVRGNMLSRGLGIYGCIFGPLTAIAVLSGHLRLNVHGFGLVVLGQAAWFITAGVLLWRSAGPATAASSD
jgi:hypothetical protein